MFWILEVTESEEELLFLANSDNEAPMINSSAESTCSTIIVALESIALADFSVDGYIRIENSSKTPTDGKKPKRPSIKSNVERVVSLNVQHNVNVPSNGIGMKKCREEGNSFGKVGEPIIMLVDRPLRCTSNSNRAIQRS